MWPALGLSGREMELTRTCCFEFDRKKGPDSKRLFLLTFCFYFRVAGFTYFSPLPEADKNLGLMPSTILLHFERWNNNGLVPLGLFCLCIAHDKMINITKVANFKVILYLYFAQNTCTHSHVFSLHF